MSGKSIGSTGLASKSPDMDGFVKFILAVVLATMPFLFKEQMSFGVLTGYLVFLTLASRIKLRTLLISTASYAIIVVIPFLFSLFLNELLYSVTKNELFTMSQGNAEVFLRLFKLFIIWYVSILYFHTTPIQTVIGLLDKLLTPFQLIGVPVKDYLKVVMCIVLELKHKGTELKNEFFGHARSAMGEHQGKLKFNVKKISQVIVTMLVNSFEKLDEIQKFVENVSPNDLFHYKFKVNKIDGIAVASLMLLVTILYIIEKGLI